MRQVEDIENEPIYYEDVTSMSNIKPDIKPKEKKLKPEKRPEVLQSKTTKVKTGHGTLYITVSYLDNKPFEVFCTIGKSGADVSAKAEAIGRLCSLVLRLGGSIDEIVKQLIGIYGSSPHSSNGRTVLSIPDAIAQILKNS